MLNNLSFKLKVPVLIIVLILITVGVLTTVIATKTYQNSREALFENAKQLGGTLAATLEPAIRTDSIWQAYTMIKAPLSTGLADELSPHIIVVDHLGRIFSSSNPDLFPTFTNTIDLPKPYARNLSNDRLTNSSIGAALEDKDEKQLYVVTPINSNGINLGFVVMIFSQDILLPNVFAIIRSILLSTIVILLLLLPFGWYVGRNLVSPLLHLAHCMEKLPGSSPNDIDFNPSHSSDEIGLLSTRFQIMLNELSHMKGIERRIVAEDRLAAIGRMTAGIAHEINNPLGGMLNSINTFRHHRADPKLVDKTYALIERGLLQIKETVSALLVEGKLETHPFSANDIADVKTLIEPGIHEKSGKLNWHTSVTHDLPLPSTQIRQILINLLLNAIEGINDRGTITCRIGFANKTLAIKVINDGSEISAEKMEHLFEPFYGHSNKGSGLGLWVTYQITDQLKGKIDVENQVNHVCFCVTLPVEL